MKEYFFDKPFVLPACVLGLSLLLGAGVVSYSLYSIRALDNTLAVTGSATENIKADNAKWTVTISRTAYAGTLPETYAAVAQDAATVKVYFEQAGITDENITQTTIFSDQNYSSDTKASTSYAVHESISVESKDVDKINNLSHNITTLVNKGVAVSAQQPEYYVSTLADLRVSLLGKAIADAKARAEQIAKSGGSSVGRLKGAASGVVQVMAPNSTSVDDYGTYDTSTIQKQVMVTARATFLVR